MQKNNNLDFINDWLTFIIKFLYQNKQNSAYFETMLLRLENYYSIKNKKEMNSMLMELRSILSTSSIELRIKLDDALREKFNLSFKDISPIKKSNQFLTEKQNSEVEFIKDWSLTIINFLKSKLNLDDSFWFDYEQIFSEEIKRKYLTETSPSIYIKGLRMVFNDINEMALDLSLQLQVELNKLLLSKFEKDLNFYSTSLSKKVRQIIKRGEIKNPNEFRLLQSRAELIYENEELKTELTEINKLMVSYEEDGRAEV